MNRTRRRRAVSILFASVLLVSCMILTLWVGALGTPRATAAAPPTSDDTPVTANPFLPEEQNIGDCLGALERPGCGSEERGGWRQTLVFVIIGAGLAFVFTMVTREVRRSRRAQEEARRDP